MERLTNKEWLEWSEDEDICSISEDADYLTKCYQKLGKLEDIEEELGIPLEVLFKALKEGIWVKHRPFENKDITFYKNCELQYQLNTWVFWIGEPDNEFVRILKEYKFGWALTREELE